MPWFIDALRHRLLPLVASAPGFEPTLTPIGGAASLRVHDAFIIKYSAGEGSAAGGGGGDGGGGEAAAAAAAAAEVSKTVQAELHRHCDQSLLSFTIGLNPCAEYKGGGTHFDYDGIGTVHSDEGCFTAFPGNLFHSGAAVTKGTRYIIVLFLYSEGWSASGVDESARDPLGYSWLEGGVADQVLPLDPSLM